RPTGAAGFAGESQPEALRGSHSMEIDRVVFRWMDGNRTSQVKRKSVQTGYHCCHLIARKRLKRRKLILGGVAHGCVCAIGTEHGGGGGPTAAAKSFLPSQMSSSMTCPIAARSRLILWSVSVTIQGLATREAAHRSGPFFAMFDHRIGHPESKCVPKGWNSRLLQRR
ncbi:MAG: hypothetical protein ABJD68_17640, partial [Nakamurella sp.]